MARLPAEERLTYLCKRDELRPGQMRSFEVGRWRIVLCRGRDGFTALRDMCPHQGARLSAGLLSGTNVGSQVGVYQYGRDCEIVRCPRHGYEYDMHSGHSLHDPERTRVRTFPVVERGDDILVEATA